MTNSVFGGGWIGGRVGWRYYLTNMTLFSNKLEKLG